MRRPFLVFVLVLGTVGGYAHAFASFARHGHGHHGRCSSHAAPSASTPAP